MFQLSECTNNIIYIITIEVETVLANINSTNINALSRGDACMIRALLPALGGRKLFRITPNPRYPLLQQTMDLLLDRDIECRTGRGYFENGRAE